VTRASANLRVLPDVLVRDRQRCWHVEHGVVRVRSCSTGSRKRNRRHGSHIRRNRCRKSGGWLQERRTNLSRKLITFALKASRTQIQF
jgi:hypothetical protein